MTKPRWTATQEISTARITQVFSGGACNILDADGNLHRNTERDAINDWLTEKDIRFFDPQIHPDTHGVEYDYEVHHSVEIAARSAARINLYELSPRTFGGITSLEIAADHFRWGEPMVLYFSDGDANDDRIPDHDKKGNPVFEPFGVKAGKGLESHYKEMVKNANNMRRYLMYYARELHNLTAMFGGRPQVNDIVITPHRMHAADIFEAVVRSAAGERIHIHIDGHETKRDKKGTPLFVVPDNPPEAELHALVDQYIDEGNALRQRIAQLIGVNVFVRVVYTQRSAIIALEEMLIQHNMLPKV